MVVARTWFSIQVELVSGRGEHYWPRPGRVFAAARPHSFGEFADAIDTAFARWDRAHLYQFVLGDGRRIGQPEFDDFDEGLIDAASTKLGALSLGEQFVFAPTHEPGAGTWCFLPRLASARLLTGLEGVHRVNEQLEVSGVARRSGRLPRRR